MVATRPLLLALTAALTFASCASQQRAALQVVAVENAAKSSVLLVQVSNPEPRAIRLQRLAYTFAGASHSSHGEVLLSRDIAAGGAAIVQVPVTFEGAGPFRLEGSLVALLDRVERTYPVAAALPDASQK